MRSRGLARAPDRYAGDHRRVRVAGVTTGTNFSVSRCQPNSVVLAACRDAADQLEEPRSPGPGFFFEAPPRMRLPPSGGPNNKTATRALRRVAALETVGPLAPVRRQTGKLSVIPGGTSPCLVRSARSSFSASYQKVSIVPAG